MLNGALGLGLVLTLKDEVTAGMARIRAGFSEFQEGGAAMVRTFDGHVDKMKGGLAAMGLGATGLMGAMRLAFGSAAEFEANITDAGVGMSATVDEMAALKDAAFDTRAALLGFDAVQTSDTLRALADEGYNAERSLAVLIPSLQLAKLTNQSASGAAGQFADILDVFKLKAEDSGAAVDKIAHTMRTMGIGSNEMTPMLLGVADAAQLTGASFDDTLLTLGLIKSAIPNVGKATMSARTAFMQLANPEMQKKITALGGGISVIDKNTSQLRPLGDILGDIANQTSKMSASQRMQAITSIFGGRAAGGMATVIEKLAEGVEDASGKIVTGAAALAVLKGRMGEAGNAAKVLDAKMGTLKGQAEILRATFTNLKTQTGLVLGPAFKPIVQGLTNAMVRLSEFLAAMPADVKEKLGKIVVGFLGIVTAVGGLFVARGALMGFGFALRTLGPASVPLRGLGGLFKGATGGLMLLVQGIRTFGIHATLLGQGLPALKGLFTALTMSMRAAALTAWTAMAPFLPIALAIGGVILLLKAMQITGNQTGQGFLGLGAVFGKVSLFFKGMKQLLTDGGFSGDVRKELNSAENGGVKAFAIKVFVWITRIKNFLTGLSDGFSAGVRKLEPVFTRVSDAFGMLMDAFSGGSNSAKDNVAAFNSAGSAGTNFGETLAKVAGVIANVVTGVVLAVTSFVEIWKFAYGIVAPIVEAIWQVVNGVFKSIFSLLTGDWQGLWEGVVDTVAGAVKVFLSIWEGAVLLVAKGIDLVGKAAGKNWNFADGIKGEFDKIKGLVDQTAADITGRKVSMDIGAQVPAGGVAFAGEKGKQLIAQAPAGMPTAQDILGSVPEKRRTELAGQMRAAEIKLGGMQGPYAPGAVDAARANAYRGLMNSAMLMRAQRLHQIGGGAPALVAPPPGATLAPGVVAARGQVDVTARTGTRVAQGVERAAAGGARETVIHAHVHADGEKIGKAVMRVRQDQAARSFSMAPAPTGG